MTLVQINKLDLTKDERNALADLVGWQAYHSLKGDKAKARELGRSVKALAAKGRRKAPAAFNLNAHAEHAQGWALNAVAWAQARGAVAHKKMAYVW